MGKVQRYEAALTTANWPRNPEKLVRDPEGEFVKYTDYAELQAALKRIVEARYKCLERRSLDADADLFDAIKAAAPLIEKVKS